MRKLLLSLLLALSSPILIAQTEYKVGTSTVSIEPDDTMYSVPLAGYGYPREGRFSIEWRKRGSAVEVKSLTGVGRILYAVNLSGALLRCNTTDETLVWEKLKEKQSLKLLAGMEECLYAITSDNCLIVGKPKRNTMKWLEKGTVPEAVGFASSGGRLYIITSDGQLQEGVIGENSVVWQRIGHAENGIALTGDNGRLYMVSNDQLLWQRKDTKPGTEWVKIGYQNGSSYTQSWRQLAVAGGKLFAVNDDQMLFMAAHNSLNDISSRAMAVTYQGQTVVIVGVDLTGFDYSLACDVKREILRKHDIPAEAVLINASHSHFSPVAQWFPTWGKHQQVPDSLYLNNRVKKGIIESIDKALANRATSTLFFGRGDTQIGLNRALSGVDALSDSSLDILRVNSKSKDKDALMFLTGCHPVFKSEEIATFTISPNFPGFARRMLEDKVDLRQAIFIQGCAGDINPVVSDPIETGHQLAGDVMKVLDSQMAPLSGDISYALDSVLLPANVWSKEQIIRFKAENSNREGDVEAEKNVRWADMMLSHYARNTVPKFMPVYIQTINIGNWKLVGLSREAVTEYSLAIRKLWPDQWVSVAGYTNDVPSYLPTAVHIRNHTYEGYGSFFWNAQPAIFPENVFDVVLKTIRMNNR